MKIGYVIKTVSNFYKTQYYDKGQPYLNLKKFDGINSYYVFDSEPEAIEEIPLVLKLKEFKGKALTIEKIYYDT